MEQQINQSDFWDDSADIAINVLAEKKDIENKISFYDKASKEFDNLNELLELSKTESDDEMLLEVENQLAEFYKNLKINICILKDL